MRARLLVTLGAALLWCAASVQGYWLLGQHWPSGRIVMHLEQGSSAGALLDGSADWDAVSEGALARWNGAVSGLSFSVVRGSSSKASLRNGVNDVLWGDNVYGDSFGDAAAVTTSLYRASDNSLTETDVIFNRGLSWNSYRGNLRRTSSGTDWLYDLRRVALHEFGHVLGLDHPDEHGQSVDAIMNSIVSNTDDLRADDVNGATAIYGSSSNHAPTVSATCDSCSVRGGQTITVKATAADADGDALTYRWSAGQGTFANATAASSAWTAPKPAGSVAVTVAVSDGRGGSATSSVTIQVFPRDQLTASAPRLLPGESLTSGSDRYRLVYQNDGNLVLYDTTTGSPLWWSGTMTATPGQAVLQGDGNLVIYDAAGKALWWTGTTGHAGSFLAVQDDGNLVVYGGTGLPTWTRPH